MHDVDKDALEAAWDVLDGVLDRSGEMCPFCCSDIADAIRAYEDALWRPIEMAPFATDILITDGKSVADSWKGKSGEWYGESYRLVQSPTHWRPLPNPPGGQEK